MIDDRDRLLVAGERDRQVGHLQQRRPGRRVSGHRRESGAERVAEPIAHEVEGEDGDGDRAARDPQQPSGLVDLRVGATQHHAPARSGQLCPESEEAQGRFGEQREPGGDRGLHDERRRHIVQHAFADDEPGLGSDRTRRLDVGLLAHADDLPPHETDESGREDERERERDIGGTRTEDPRDHEREHERGDDLDRVRDAHERLVDPTTDEPGKEPERHRDDEREADGNEAHLQRDAGAVDDPREHVATEVVLAEPVRTRRLLVDLGEVLHVGVLESDAPGEHGRDDEQHEVHGRGNGNLVPPEALPEVDVARQRVVRCERRRGPDAFGAAFDLRDAVERPFVTARGQGVDVGVVGVQVAHSTRTFGLRIAYEMSTTRFTRTVRIAMNRHRTLNCREIVLLHCSEHVRAQPRDAEDRLHDDRAPDQVGDLETDDGENRGRRVLQCVLADDLGGGQPDRPARPDVVARHRVGERAAQLSRDRRGGERAERDPRQEEVLEPLVGRLAELHEAA